MGTWSLFIFETPLSKFLYKRSHYYISGFEESLFEHKTKKTNKKFHEDLPQFVYTWGEDEIFSLLLKNPLTMMMQNLFVMAHILESHNFSFLVFFLVHCL